MYLGDVVIHYTLLYVDIKYTFELTCVVSLS